MKPHLAITMGDPAGVGPEIIVKACAALRGRLERATALTVEAPARGGPAADPGQRQPAEPG